MKTEGKKIISGGITGKLAARELGQELLPDNGCLDPEIPPTSKIRGIDLVTEGVITLNKVVQMLREYISEEVSVAFFEELDKDNGASRIARLLIEDCTTVYLFVGRGVNEAYKEKNMPFDVTARKNLIQQLEDVLKKMKIKTLAYYY